ncbi:MAG: pyrroline-5-carboxylate reductase [Desulfovibrionaceae bacterium]
MQSSSAIGCIGCGNMGGAIMSGLADRANYTLYGYNRTPERMEILVDKGLKPMADVGALVQACDVIIIAVKPFLVEKVLRQIQKHLTKDKLLISVAAGVTTGALSEGVQGLCPVVRVMPNTPALVGAGVFALCFDDPALTIAHKALVQELLGYLGETIEMPEKNFVAFSALVGAGPAYVFHFMDAVVQAGVTMGFPRAEAKRMVLGLFAGSVRMAAASEHSLTDLRDQVCSPAGLTIEAVNYLDRTALRGHIVDAVLAAAQRGAELEG